MAKSSGLIAYGSLIIGRIWRSRDVLLLVNYLKKVAELIKVFFIKKIDITLNKVCNSMIRIFCILFGNRLTSSTNNCENRKERPMGRQFDGAAYIRAMKSMQILQLNLSAGAWTNASVIGPNSFKLFRLRNRQCLDIRRNDLLIGRSMCWA